MHAKSFTLFCLAQCSSAQTPTHIRAVEYALLCLHSFKSMVVQKFFKLPLEIGLVDVNVYMRQCLAGIESIARMKYIKLQMKQLKKFQCA